MKIRIIDFFLTLDKNPSHRDRLYSVALLLREHTWVIKDSRQLPEHVWEEDATECHSGELIEMATIMSLFSENSMACYTDRNKQIRLLCGST